MGQMVGVYNLFKFFSNVNWLVGVQKSIRKLRHNSWMPSSNCPRALNYELMFKFGEYLGLYYCGGTRGCLGGPVYSLHIIVHCV